MPVLILAGMGYVIIVAVLLIAAGGLVAVIVAGRRDAGPQEWERTCRRCSAVWYVPQAEAREQAPDRAQMTSAKLYRAGKRASIVTTRAAAAELRVQNLEDKAARVQARDRCPSCGSTSFDAVLIEA